MGSKPIQDDDSLSASSFLPPQIRHSRRGSLASLSSANQLDKEALSQALDQIHSAASQTETLTTFNEYTSPPASSSGPDTKGIASELQGGLSGLYNRFRASVGNVKDIVNLGAEDGAVENTVLKSPRTTTYSPKPPSKNAVEFARGPSSSDSTNQATSAPESGRQSPLDHVNTEGEHHEIRQSLKPSTKSLGSVSTSAKSAGSLTAPKLSPVTLTPAAQPTTISPTLADVNISAVKRVGVNADPVSAVRTTTHPEPQRLTRDSRRQSYLAEPSARVGVDASGSTPLEAISKKSSQSGPKQKGEEPGLIDVKSTFKSPDEYEIVGTRAASMDRVRPFPDLEDGPDETPFAATGSSSDPINMHMIRPAMVVTNYGNEQDDMFSVPDIDNTGGAIVDDAAKIGGGYQHLKLSLRKTMAPPLITRSHSSNLSTSPVSSPDNESLNRSPLPMKSRKPPTGWHEVLPTHNSNSQYVASTASRRDSRTMNVFSQVKNKVLNKEYWMKDENARDCFYCGDSFSTFRRKHHCSKY